MERDYKIHIEQVSNDKHEAILQAYWEMDENGFMNKPTLICETYNITTSELNKIVKNNSYCLITLGSCSDCGLVNEEVVYSQTKFKEKRYVKKRCSECEQKHYRELEVARASRREVEEQEREMGFRLAIKEKRWNDLTDEEFGILKKIILIKDKSEIYKHVFKGNAFDKSVWRKVRNIEKKRLIAVERNDGGGVVQFSFPEELESLFSRDETSNDELNFLSFSLAKNLHKNKERQPDYSGKFILKKPVKLDAGVKYIYGGWKNTDGSINLKIQPLDEIQNAVQYPLNREPRHIGKILDDVFNQIDQKEVMGNEREI